MGGGSECLSSERPSSGVTNFHLCCLHSTADEIHTAHLSGPARCDGQNHLQYQPAGLSQQISCQSSWHPALDVLNLVQFSNLLLTPHSRFPPKAAFNASFRIMTDKKWNDTVSLTVAGARCLNYLCWLYLEYPITDVLAFNIHSNSLFSPSVITRTPTGAVLSPKASQCSFRSRWPSQCRRHLIIAPSSNKTMTKNRNLLFAGKKTLSLIWTSAQTIQLPKGSIWYLRWSVEYFNLWQ